MKKLLLSVAIVATMSVAGASISYGKSPPRDFEGSKAHYAMEYHREIVKKGVGNYDWERNINSIYHTFYTTCTRWTRWTGDAEIYVKKWLSCMNSSIKGLGQ